MFKVFYVFFYIEVFLDDSNEYVDENKVWEDELVDEEYGVDLWCFFVYCVCGDIV